ncbi:denticleless protein-like protein [Dinothrombium tinctorium]|uniref:Denticleless protein-like protein n=1 Tax=Dinothrombium tinctorium TaxID=1965070 RepID=A0A443RFK9_9ACAR|nr:denticleless protein-like protein [Dinothrombium tinctorium]
MSFSSFLFQRELGFKPNSSYFDILLDKYKLNNIYSFEDQFNDVSSPLSLSTNSESLAVVTEYGNISLLTKKELKKVQIWQGHNNAIFDVKWRINYDNHILTASGDQSVALWDIFTYKKIFQVEGAHKSSIKSISFGDENKFVSGARDGIIKIWDIRSPNVNEITSIVDAHKSSYVKRSNSKHSRSNPLNSVTCVLFVPQSNFIYSGGANDATIKLWDIRKLSVKGKCKPVKLLPYLGTSYTSAHGFTSLALDSRNRLFGSCTDHCIYCFYPNDESSAIRHIGHQVNNYTKIRVFQDKYLISGSTDGNVYIWSLLGKNHRGLIWPYCTFPHGIDEVTAVDCDYTNFSIYSCSDDLTVKQWQIQPLRDANFSTLSDSEVKAQKFKCKDGVVLKESQIERKLSTITPKMTPTPQPLSLITNWFQKQKDEMTPTNAKVPRLANSTPKKVFSKENRSKSKRIEMSRKLLFQRNRKISDYLVHL